MVVSLLSFPVSILHLILVSIRNMTQSYHVNTFLGHKILFFPLVIETIMNQAYSNSIFFMIKYGQVMTSPSICKHLSLKMTTWLPSSDGKRCPNSLRASKAPLMNPTLDARCEFWATSADVWRAMVGLALAPFQALIIRMWRINLWMIWSMIWWYFLPKRSISWDLWVKTMHENKRYTSGQL